MDLPDLLMNYPTVMSQVEAFKDECGDDDSKHYQVKWLWPRFFPLTVRLKLRYLPSKKDGKFQKVLPLAIRA